MAVTVTTYAGGFDEYANATGWHVDDERQLHVFKKAAGGTSDSLGSYANGAWLAVQVSNEVKMG